MARWMTGVARAGLLVWLVCPALAYAQSAQPPNLVFILVDDLRYDAMGFVTPQIETPNIDALAAQGAYLPNAVVTTALCSPSRATILTGLSARNHGVVDNNDTSEADLHYFPQVLQADGYNTAFVGKWHMGRGNDDPRPGFDHWVSFKGQGNYYPTDMIPAELVAQGIRHQLNVNGTRVDQQGYITDELTDYALDWLARTPADEPFFLYLSHKAVHSDFKPAPRHAQQYVGVELDLPDPDADAGAAGAGKPMWVHNQRNSWHGVDFPYHSDLSIAEYLRRYYQTLSAVDDSVGRLVSWLRDQQRLDNTVLVFYSDNGFLFGEHGLIDKRNAYEPSVRVPMLVLGPGRIPAGKTLQARVRNLDIAPTFLDLAGADIPAVMEGQSLAGLLTGQVDEQQWQPAPFVYEYYWEWTFPQTPTTLAITRDEIKYIQYHGLWDLEELYDLRKDPGEHVNLIHDPDYVGALVRLRQALYEAMVNSAGQHVVPYTRRQAAGLALRRRQGAPTADFPDSFLRAPGDPDLFQGFRLPAVPVCTEGATPKSCRAQ